mgnify:CR=1 FL=1
MHVRRGPVLSIHSLFVLVRLCSFTRPHARHLRRCQDSTNRLAVKFKVREGRSAALSAFVLPAISPKACVVVRHTIRPLCLHQRIVQMDTSRPTNELLITGEGCGRRGVSGGDVGGKGKK